MSQQTDSSRLADLVSGLVEAAKRAGADASDAVAVRSRSTSVSVRLGKVEETESSESDDVSLRVFIGKRVASVSANAASDPATLAERAVAMAKVSPEDPHQGLADASLLARAPRDLDLFDGTEISADRLREDALAIEETALAVEGVKNSGGSGASAGMGGLVLATSHGFFGEYVASRFSRSISVIAGEGTGMERDYDFSSRQHFADLDATDVIGRKAAERAVRRIGARKAKTGPVTVIFDPRVARGIAGHLAGAINGASVARKTSFLRDFMGKQVAATAITVTDDPLRRRGQSSRPFDGEGVEGTPHDDGRSGRPEPLVPVRLGGKRAWVDDEWPRRSRRILCVAVLDESLDRTRHADAGGPDPVARLRLLRDGGLWAGRQHGDGRVFARRVWLLDRKRRTGLAGRGSDHRRQSEGHVPKHGAGRRCRSQFRHGSTDASDRRA
jgi:PmbA protein